MEISESQTFAVPENILEASSADKNLDDPLSDSSIMTELTSIIENKFPENSSNVNEETYEESQTSCNNQDSNIKLSENVEDEWLDIMGSGNFKKKVIKPGVGHETRPGRGDKVIIDISYFINGSLFEERKDLTFIVGDLDVIQGLDLAICLMEKGEKAKLQIPSKLAYGSNGLLPDVPPDADIECDIELKEVETVDEVLLSVSDRLKLGDEKRLRGNFFYDRGQHIDAIHCYERAAEYLDGFRANADSSPEELLAIVDLRLKVHKDMAASRMKLETNIAALKSMESVLKVQPKKVKALLSKGKQTFDKSGQKIEKGVFDEGMDAINEQLYEYAFASIGFERSKLLAKFN